VSDGFRLHVRWLWWQCLVHGRLDRHPNPSVSGSEAEQAAHRLSQDLDIDLV
jgi:hypothetical protein